jgi:hypothetical protein
MHQPDIPYPFWRRPWPLVGCPTCFFLFIFSILDFFKTSASHCTVSCMCSSHSSAGPCFLGTWFWKDSSWKCHGIFHIHSWEASSRCVVSLTEENTWPFLVVATWTSILPPGFWVISSLDLWMGNFPLPLLIPPLVSTECHKLNGFHKASHMYYREILFN